MSKPYTCSNTVTYFGCESPQYEQEPPLGRLLLHVRKICDANAKNLSSRFIANSMTTDICRSVYTLLARQAQSLKMTSGWFGSRTWNCQIFTTPKI